MNVAIVSFAVPVAIAGTIVILIAARRDADPDRRRTEARYLGAVCFLAVFVTLFAAYAVVAQLSSFIIDREQSDAFSFDEESVTDPLPLPRGGGRASDDATWRGTVQAALLTAAATGVLMFHRGRRRDLRATPGFTDSAAARVDTAYLYVACFLAAFVVLVAAAYGTYGIFRVIAPGVTGFDSDVERQKGIAQAISLAALGAGAALVFMLHWRERPIRVDGPMTPAPT